MRSLAAWATAFALLAGCAGSNPPTATNGAGPALDGPSPSAASGDDVRYVSDDARVAQQRTSEGRPLFDYDPSASLNLELGEPVGFAGDLSLIDIAYDSPRGGRVSGFLMLPDDVGDPPVPGLIIQHGMPGDAREMLDIAKDYGAAGVASILIDAPWARNGRTGQSVADILAFTAEDHEDQVQLIVDLRRAVDVLEDLPDVDGDRVGYLGYSYGAAMGALLAGVESRIEAFELMVGDGGLVEHLSGPGADAALGSLPSAQRTEWIEAMEPIEPLYYVRDATAPLMLQNGRHDPLVAEADAMRLHEAAPEPKRVEWYDSGHQLPMAAYCDGALWLGDILGFNGSAAGMCRP